MSHKKKPQLQSIPPEFGGVQSTTPELQLRQSFPKRGGTGFVPPTIKGEDVAEVPAQPPLEGTFTDVKTGRPSGVSIGGKSFFLQGEDLELFKRQQEEKDLSGSAFQKTIGEAAAARELQQQPQLPREQLLQGPFGVQGQLPLATNFFREISTSKLLDKIAKGEGTPEEIAMLGLTPLDLEILQSGQANINRLGQFAEGIGILGRIKTPGGVGVPRIGVSDFIGITPSKKVDMLLKDLRDLDGNLETDSQKAQLNPFLLNGYISDVKEAEQTALELQSRIKLLYIQSPSLQSDPDNIDRVMAEIDDALDKIELRKLKLGIA